jgi:hypothetical protein
MILLLADQKCGSSRRLTHFPTRTFFHASTDAPRRPARSKSTADPNKCSSTGPSAVRWSIRPSVHRPRIMHELGDGPRGPCQASAGRLRTSEVLNRYYRVYRDRVARNTAGGQLDSRIHSHHSCLVMASLMSTSWTKTYTTIHTQIHCQSFVRGAWKLCQSPKGLGSFVRGWVCNLRTAKE